MACKKQEQAGRQTWSGGTINAMRCSNMPADPSLSCAARQSAHSGGRVLQSADDNKNPKNATFPGKGMCKSLCSNLYLQSVVQVPFSSVMELACDSAASWQASCSINGAQVMLMINKQIIQIRATPCSGLCCQYGYVLAHLPNIMGQIAICHNPEWRACVAFVKIVL